MSVVPRPIFVHGAGLSAGSWRFQEPCFEGGRLVTLPGRPAGAPLARIEDMAAAVLEAAGEGPLVVVGHSMGGQIALQAALDAPDRVVGVVLVASGARIEVPERAFVETRTDFVARCERFVAACYHRPDDGAVAHDVEAMRAVGADTVLADYAAVAACDLRPRLGEVRTPALVVAAGEDRITPTTLSEELATGLPQAIRVLVPDTGHFLPVEAADTLNLLVAGFLARVEISLSEP